MSGLYRDLFPNIRLETVDRPVPPGQPGFSAEACRRVARCERHYEIDLERQPLSATSGGPESRRFDLVLFAEVLEHLTVNPTDLLAELLVEG